MSDDLLITLILAALLIAALFGRAAGRTAAPPQRTAVGPPPKPRRARSKSADRDRAVVERRAADGAHGPALVSLLQAVLAESRLAGAPPGGARIVAHAGAHDGYALNDWPENAPYLHLFAREPAGVVEADLMLSYGVKGHVFGYAAVIVDTRRD
ncbi:MAG: hypothetical protein AAF684_03715, partial [Pseudomonadota bacterium]